MNKPYIIFALPCYNEAENIVPLLDQFSLLNKVYGSIFETRVLVINDCSKDDTRAKAESYKADFPLEILNHESNKGLTGGINSAFKYFYSKVKLADPNLIAFGLMDGDNSHTPLHAPQMFEKILQSFDVVVASRYQNGSHIEGVAWWRQFLSLGLAFFFKLIRNIPGVRDYSCGYRLYSPRIIELVVNKYGQEVVTEKSFASMVEILVKCHNSSAICTEVPMNLRYDLKQGQSKMKFIKTIIGNLKILAKG